MESQTPVSAGSLCESAPQRVRRHEVRERPRAVDFDDRQELPEAALELGIAGDVDLLELERLLGANGVEHPPRRRAQAAIRRVVEDDAGYG
jgi:hypothetical protein